jgi:hypothetical protein
MKSLLKYIVAFTILIGTGMFATAQLDVSITVRTAPPELPVYSQPYCPGDGYLWIPGYWAYDVDGYYWVPGAWVLPPEYGLYWTTG